KDGVSQPETLHKKIAKVLSANRKKTPSANELVEGILQHNQTALSRAITIIESTAQKHQQQANEIIETCLPHATQYIRIGITGVPEVGKRTFIESFGKFLISKGKKVAVLTVDPSSRS